jgi:uncharacterized protein
MKNNLIKKAEQLAKEHFKSDSSGHDWYHTNRVRNLAVAIAKDEGADIFICELAALLHDVADEKLNESAEAGESKVKSWLNNNVENKQLCADIMEIITTISFKGGHGKEVSSLEAKVVQDADRLDAIGAIGIARTFAYSGAKGQAIYDPEIAVRTEMTKEQYRNEKSTAINHFYEKLFKLKDRMNTKSAIKIAEDRHRYMEQFVHTFLGEWNE